MNPKVFKSFLGAISVLLLVTIFGGFAPFGISARADTTDGVSHRAGVSWLLHDDWHIIRDWKNFKKAMTESADIKFIHIQGFTYDLNNIEHNILRPVFKDARVHAAVNCASYSCPRLLNAVYTAEKLDEQLYASWRCFFNDLLPNRITAEKDTI